MPTNYIIDNFGLKKSLILNGVLMIIGIWVKILINKNFWYVIIGNAICGIGRNIILTGPPIVALKWYFPKNTPIITSILMMGNPVGVLFGYWLPD